MKVLFAGGGTAGHINPALAIAGYLREKQPDAEILFIGNRGGMEEKLVPKAGFDMKTIVISGFQRKMTPKAMVHNVKTVMRVLSSSPSGQGDHQSVSARFVRGDRRLCQRAGDSHRHENGHSRRDS